MNNKNKVIISIFGLVILCYIIYLIATEPPEIGVADNLFMGLFVTYILAPLGIAMFVCPLLTLSK